MSFRQYGGINYAARNNIVKNNYTNATNLSVMNKVGQTGSIITFDSDIAFEYTDAPTYGIRFSDGTFQNTAYEGTDSNWTLDGNNIYNNNSGNVGIGTTSPVQKLHVSGNMYIEPTVTTTINNPAFKIELIDSNCLIYQGTTSNDTVIQNNGGGSLKLMSDIGNGVYIM